VGVQRAAHGHQRPRHQLNQAAGTHLGRAVPAQRHRPILRVVVCAVAVATAGEKNQDSPDLAQTPLPLADPLALAILEPVLRLFEVDPNPVLPWLVEAAEQLRAFCAYFLCDGHCQLNAKLSRIGKILDSLLSQNGVFGDVKGREISFDRRIIH